MLTGQRCSQPTRQRGTQSAGQVNGGVRISEIGKCRQRLPSQPFCHRWGGRVSLLCLWFLINVIPALFPLIHMKLNSPPTEIVTFKSQRGINLKTRRAFIWSNKHPSYQGKALLCHNVCVLGGKNHYCSKMSTEGRYYKMMKMNHPWCSNHKALFSLWPLTSSWHNSFVVHHLISLTMTCHYMNNHFKSSFYITRWRVILFYFIYLFCFLQTEVCC